MQCFVEAQFDQSGTPQSIKIRLQDLWIAANFLRYWLRSKNFCTQKRHLTSRALRTRINHTHQQHSFLPRQNAYAIVHWIIVVGKENGALRSGNAPKIEETISCELMRPMPGIISVPVAPPRESTTVAMLLV